MLDDLAANRAAYPGVARLWDRYLALPQPTGEALIDYETFDAWAEKQLRAGGYTTKKLMGVITRWVTPQGELRSYLGALDELGNTLPPIDPAAPAP